PARLVRVAVSLKPSTLLNLHRALVQRKYRLLFSPKHRAKPGPRGPDPDLIRAVVDMKQRNPNWGCPRIAAQINLAFWHFNSVSTGKLDTPCWNLMDLPTNCLQDIRP